VHNAVLSAFTETCSAIYFGSFQTLIIMNPFLLSQLYPLFALFHLFQFFNPRNKYCEGMFFFLPQNVVLPTCQSEILILFLCWSFYRLTDSCCPLSPPCIHSALQIDACYVYHLVDLFTSGALLTFLFFLFLLLFLLSSCFPSYLLLLQSVSTANLSETACFLMS
jgi:hypothetical protein